VQRARNGRGVLVSRRSLLICALVLSSAGSAHATDYYLSAAGNDGAAGTSPTTAWRSLARVNSVVLRPGDRVLLNGGNTFTGTLSLDAADYGTAAAPVAVQSYGSGRATIAPTGAGIYVYNTSGIAISNLVVTGSGGNASGISFYTDLAGDVRLPFVRIDNVDVSGFGRDGIEIGAWNGATGFRDVSVTNSAVHGNARTGLFVYAKVPNVHQQVYVGRVRAYGNTGIAGAASNSGSGIVVASANGATIERSVAYDNGRLCTSSGGPVGIWTYDSTGVAIRHNESYANRTGGGWDGGGFDLDQNVSNSIVEYNYSHDNDGAGYLLAQSLATDVHRGNVVRYNISQNDGRANSYAGIEVWGRVMSAEIYNNTVFVSPAASGAPRAVRVWNAGAADRFVNGVHLRNNILFTTGALPLVEATAGALAGAVDLRFEGNDYFTAGSTPAFLWGGTRYSGLSAWRATGQEVAAGVTTGMTVDPQLIAAGGGSAVDSADRLESLDAYRLRETSPLVDAGLDLAARFGVSPGPADFFGAALPQRAAYDIGASELAYPETDIPPLLSPDPIAMPAPDPAPVGATVPPPPTEIVVYASDLTSASLHGNWVIVADATAAGGKALSNPDKGAVKIGTAAAFPLSYVDVPFTAQAGVPYQVWLRMRAAGNSYTNDSVYVQLSGAVDVGQPVARIGTTDASAVVLQDYTGAPISGWGWNDNGWTTIGTAFVFAQSGAQTLRLQQREDGILIDQIVLSPVRYLTSPPGPTTNDTTIVIR
jgi:hypothetical protein